MKNVRELYKYLQENYGKRKLYISEIAQDLKISYEEANTLTLALGYRQGKCETIRSYKDFIQDPEVNRIWERIQAKSDIQKESTV